MQQDDINRVYKEIPLKKIPWIYETPPAILIELINSGKIKPCKTIDLGCGTGNYAIYLARKGFTVTGIDISPAAIKIAKRNADEKKVKCNFLVADVLADLNELKQNYDFAYDWEVLHHIFPEKREIYIKNVYNLLNPEGIYLSVSFSDKDPCFGSQRKYRKTPLGTILYFSSENELKELFSSFFNIEILKTIEIRGKPISHLANYAFMKRKN
ncbi:MAG: class I SAM-dependent methyltransferase [Candidatus Hodarchaeota archaeon]